MIYVHPRFTKLRSTQGVKNFLEIAIVALLAVIFLLIVSVSSHGASYLYLVTYSILCGSISCVTRYIA